MSRTKRTDTGSPALPVADRHDLIREKPSVAPLLAKLLHTLESFVEIGLGYLSLDGRTGLKETCEPPIILVM